MSMNEKNQNAPKNWRVLDNLASLIKVNLIIAACITISFHPEKVFDLAILKEWPEFTYSFFISFVLSWGISVIIDFTDRKISWIHAPGKRFVVEVLSVSTYAFIIGISFSTVSLIWIYGYSLSDLSWAILLRSTKWPIIISLLVTAIFTCRAFLFEWRAAAIATEKLRADRYQGQYQSLKNQLNPHFLFNSLNTLTNLVYDDQKKAVGFIQKLSKIYRYVIEVQKEELIPLHEEINFIQSYIELQKMRFGDNFQVEIGKLDFTKLIPPLSLQLLLENAIKHNVISTEDPLQVKIEQQGNLLLITNNLQKKELMEDSTGIGLNNIDERLKFFSDHGLAIIQTEEYFQVQLPLIERS